MLLAAAILGVWLLGRIARVRGGDHLSAQADALFYPVVISALVGARLFYGIFTLDVYGRTPSLFWALRVGDIAWPGALLGGIVAGYAWSRWRRLDTLALADSVVALVGLKYDLIGLLDVLLECNQRPVLTSLEPDNHRSALGGVEQGFGTAIVEGQSCHALALIGVFVVTDKAWAHIQQRTDLGIGHCWSASLTASARRYSRESRGSCRNASKSAGSTVAGAGSMGSVMAVLTTKRIFA